MTILLQHLAPKKLLTKIANFMANCETTLVKNYLINNFIKKYRIDLSEAVRESSEEYISFNDFFTRTLKSNARPLDNSQNSLISPVDGYLSQFGIISQDKLIQAKHKDYKLQALLGDETLSKNFINGNFATIYLAPHNYHRVHMPIDGVLEKMIYIPGKLFSVNTKVAENIDNLFTKNERVVAVFNTNIGKFAMVFVGAVIVGSIETTWHGTVTPPHGKEKVSWEYNKSSENYIKFNKGDEIGLFKLGSTVIMLFEDKDISWENFSLNQEVQFGQKIAIKQLAK